MDRNDFKPLPGEGTQKELISFIVLPFSSFIFNWNQTNPFSSAENHFPRVTPSSSVCGQQHVVDWHLLYVQFCRNTTEEVSQFWKKLKAFFCLLIQSILRKKKGLGVFLIFLGKSTKNVNKKNQAVLYADVPCCWGSLLLNNECLLFTRHDCFSELEQNRNFK